MRLYLSSAHSTEFASMEKEENDACSSLSKRKGASKSSCSEALDTGEYSSNFQLCLRHRSQMISIT